MPDGAVFTGTMSPGSWSTLERELAQPADPAEPLESASGSEDKDGRIASGSGSGSVTRSSKACEPCRARKSRCDIATQSICSECLKRNQITECIIRERARPNRKGKLPAPTGENSRKRARSPVQEDDHSAPQTISYNPFLSPGQQLDASFHRQHVSFQSPDTRGTVVTPTSTSIEEQARVSGPAMVDNLIRARANQLHDLDVSPELPTESILNPIQARRFDLSSIGFIPGSSKALKMAYTWIHTYFRAIHHNTPFLDLHQVLDIATSVYGTQEQNPVDNDKRALLFAVLALGSLREHTFDQQTGSYVPTSASDAPRTAYDTIGRPSPATSDPSPPLYLVPQCLFQMAQDELEQVDIPTEISVQTLFLLHTFVSLTSMSRRSRDYIARAIMMAHELGLNRRIPLNLHDVRGTNRHGLRRRAILYLYVLFSDMYLAALESHAPFIKRSHYDSDLFDVIEQMSSSGIDTPSGTPLSGLRGFVDLVTTISGVLETLHGKHRSSDISHVETILRLDKEMEDLRGRLRTNTFSANLASNQPLDAEAPRRSATAGSLLRRIHYNWGRIALRAPFLEDPLLCHSSLSICARSAVSVISLYRMVIKHGLLMLPWMQLRRIATSIYIVFLSLWAGEISHLDAEVSAHHTIELLHALGTRWRSAEKVIETVILLGARSGLSIPPPSPAILGSLGDQSASVANPSEGVESSGDPFITDPAPFSAMLEDSLHPFTQLFDLNLTEQLNSEFAFIAEQDRSGVWDWTQIPE